MMVTKRMGGYCQVPRLGDGVAQPQFGPEEGGGGRKGMERSGADRRHVEKKKGGGQTGRLKADR